MQRDNQPNLLKSYFVIISLTILMIVLGAVLSFATRRKQPLQTNRTPIQTIIPVATNTPAGNADIVNSQAPIFSSSPAARFRINNVNRESEDDNEREFED